MRSVLQAAAILLFISVSPLALATDSGFYVGVGVTNGSMTSCLVNDCNKYTENARESSHGRLIVGYDFNRFIGIEGGYSDYGSYPVKNAFSSYVGTVRIQGVSLAARGGYKFPFGLSIFGKLGLSSMSTYYTRNSLLAWPVTGDSNKKSTGLLLGIGVQYDFNDTFAIRVISEGASFDDGIYQGAVAGFGAIGILRF